MTDILERLRITEADGRHLPLHELRQEAATEIERLRGLLAECDGYLDYAELSLKQRVREALGE